MMSKAIVLLSGGLDSATVLFYAKKKKVKCICLTFRYGQRHRREIESAKKIARKGKVPLYIIDVDIPRKASALTNTSRNICYTKEEKIGQVIPSTYVPARNIIFLSLALSWAEAQKCSEIFIGANSIDYSGYPDCRPRFIKAFEKIAQLGMKSGITGNPIRISAPLLFKSKSQIIKLAKRLGVPLELTWSCYFGRSRPCNKCESCKLRARGFKEAGLKDPLIKDR